MRIKKIHEEFRATYGAPRVHFDLAVEGVRISRKGVAPPKRGSSSRRDGTKGWSVEAREIPGVEGVVTTIRFGKDGYELVTDAGVFGVRPEALEKPMSKGARQVLAAQRLRATEPPYPPGMAQLDILDR